MRPEAGQVLHFSKDPTITRFDPHVAATAQHPEPLVWALDAAAAPSYWFPRDCPRVLAWARPTTSSTDRERALGPGGGDRVHAIEYSWLDRFASVALFAYRFSADQFEARGEPENRYAN